MQDFAGVVASLPNPATVRGSKPEASTSSGVYARVSGTESGGKSHCLALSGDGAVGAVGRDDKALFVFDAGNGGMICRLQGHEREVTAAG